MKIRYNDNETIIYKNNKIQPIYSVKNSKKLFDKILRKILINKNYKKKVLVENYNVLSVALEDFFWQYCFQYTKYKNFINKKGINLKITNPQNALDYQIDGYRRVRDYLNGNFNIKNILNFYIKHCLFYLWIFFNIFYKKKTWVDRRFSRDFRYEKLNFKKLSFITLPFSLQSFRHRNLKIEKALVNDAIAKINNYKKWIFAIKLLKPKQIFLTDNLYDNFSLLLAAKLTGTKCIAISHSPNVRYHMNTFGSNLLQKKELLLFDKIYVYHKIFKNFMVKYGYFYKKNQIDVCKWPNTNKYNFNIKKNNNNNIYILYPFEHFCNFKKINSFLTFFNRKGHKIIIKKRPDMNNYNHFDDHLNIEFINDFTKEQISNCFCAIGSTTTLLFNLSQNYIPIVYIKNNGFDYYEGLDYPENWLKFGSMNKKNYNQIKNFYPKKKMKLI